MCNILDFLLWKRSVISFKTRLKGKSRPIYTSTTTYGFLKNDKHNLSYKEKVLENYIAFSLPEYTLIVSVIH